MAGMMDLRRSVRWLAWGGVATVLVLAGCPPVTPPGPPTVRAAGGSLVALTMARGEGAFVSLASRLSGAGVVEIPGEGGAGELAPRCRLYALREHTGTAASPAADQLLGTPVAAADTGSVLVPVGFEDRAGGRVFHVADAGNLYLYVETPVLMAPGTYRVAVRGGQKGEGERGEKPVASSQKTVEDAATAPAKRPATEPNTQPATAPDEVGSSGARPAMPPTPAPALSSSARTVITAAVVDTAPTTGPSGSPSMPGGPSTAGTPMPQVDVVVTVSDVTLPGAAGAWAVGTTTTAELAGLYPGTFGKFQSNFLDRGDVDHAAAMAQLDALVRIAHERGVALFVEDVGPAVKIDAAGAVELDWDAYDRTMFPYMDGTAFADRKPLAVWLVPVPPRRIRETPTQLRQYWLGCLDHLRQKNWTAAPVLMHPALVDGAAEDVARSVREMAEKQLGEKGPIVVGTPNAGTGGEGGAMWVVQDSDRRLPPVGLLGNEQSVRVWPWMCQARGLKGFVWRHAVAAEGPPKGGTTNLPLVALDAAGNPLPTLRLAWLSAGLTDAARFDLLTRRSDKALAAEVLAGVVGRTGLGNVQAASPAGPVWQPGSAGYLYAGWPTNPQTWAALPGMLDKLIAAHTPGQDVKVSPDDPLYLATKMWLAQAHRPVARVAGYSFALEPGREGSVLTMHTGLMIENPVDLEAGMDVAWLNLPGNLTLAKDEAITVPPYGLMSHTVKVAGHLDLLAQPGAAYPLQLTERIGGAELEFPAMAPVYRMHATEESPRLDGKGGDWPADPQGYGPMHVGVRYASRTDLLNGQVRQAVTPARGEGATARWSFDNDNIYVLIACPQGKPSDQRSSEWALESKRWWGTDGVQVQIAGGPRLETATRIIQVAVKPSGTVLTRSTDIVPGRALRWAEGPTGVRYGIHADARGYTVELAIPRKWFATDHDKDANVPLWRVNVLRHEEGTLQSTSWSGPVVDDEDVGMMGLLYGVK